MEALGKGALVSMKDIFEIVKHNLDVDQNMSLKESVYQALRKTIILGDIPAGVRINEMEFAEVLNISRTPIRYALQELSKENLVEHRPRIGTVVKGIRRKDAYEIFAIRKALDTLATVKAMQAMTDEDFQALETLLNDGKKLHQENRVEEVLQNFSDFNSFIYEKSDMLRLSQIVTELQTYLVYFRDVAIRSSVRRHIALEEHWRILAGMKNKEVDEITVAVHNHLDRSLQFIIQAMEQRELD